MTETECRHSIITTYARWTVLSALRRAPIRSKTVIYPLLEKVNFSAVLNEDGAAISTEEFADWHRHATTLITTARPELVVGWAAKLINIYLKTAAYVGDLGRPRLREVLHPPLDSGLWDGIKGWVLRHDSLNKSVLKKTHAVRQIKLITDYTTYETIIAGCREVAAKLPCRLIEVEQFWEGALTANRSTGS